MGSKGGTDGSPVLSLSPPLRMTGKLPVPPFEETFLVN